MNRIYGFGTLVLLLGFALRLSAVTIDPQARNFTGDGGGTAVIVTAGGSEN